MFRIPALLATAVTALLVLPAASAPTAPLGDAHEHGMIDEEHDCLQPTPQRASFSGVTDDGQDVSLDVLVLLDLEEGIDIALQQAEADTPEEMAAADKAFNDLVNRVRPLIDPALQSYAELDVTLNFADFDHFKPLDPTGEPRDRTTDEARDSQSIINQAKELFGGERPAHVDIVYVLTDLDIFAPSVGNAVAGQADCIGGVAWDDTAFAVGEISDEIPLGPLTAYREGTAKIVAHEIGHLMGAHHHYQECGRGAVTETTAGGIGACSLMTNLVDTQSFPFSVLSGLVVRAHAVDFADG